MIKLANLKIGKKLGLASVVSSLLLACVAGLALWALNDTSAGAAKAQDSALKLNLAERIDANLSELALHMSNLSTSKHVEVETEKVQAIRKEYSTDFENLKASATTDEARSLLRKIEEVIVPWRALNTEIMEAAQAGKHIDAARVSEQSLARFSALKAAVAEYLKYRQSSLDAVQKEQQATVSKVKMWLIVFSLLAVVIGIVLSRLTASSITVPLEQAVTLLDSVANGDVTQDVTPELLDREDEVGMLARAVSDLL